jgi:hypothetical protein
MNKIILAICLLMVSLVAILGLYLFLKGARRVQLAIVSTKWPTTAGKVISSETTRDVSTTRDPDTKKISPSVTFNTETKISYSVDGQSYTTDRLRFGQTLGSGDKSEADVKRLRYPPGKDVTISYDPANPASGVMKPGLHAEAFWLPGAGLAFLLPSLLCMFLLPRIVRDSTVDRKTFEDYVHTAIEQRSSNFAPPPRQGDNVMPVAATFFGAVFCCLGILALTAGLQRAWHGAVSQNWPTVSGTVIHTGEDEPDAISHAASRTRLIYKYDVAGATHFNNVRQFAQVEDVARYKTGQHVKVSYLPADPDISVLEPGNTGVAFVIPGIGMVLILFSLAVFYWIVPGLDKA